MTQYSIHTAVNHTVVLGDAPNYGSPLYIYSSIAPTALGAAGFALDAMRQRLAALGGRPATRVVQAATWPAAA